MFVTLCYVYLWVRFQKCYSAVILNTLRRLYAKDSAISFTFCTLNQSPGKWRPGGGPFPQSFDAAQQSHLLPEKSVFLQLGDKAVFITEPQVLKWSDYCVPLACSPKQPYRAVAQASVDNFSCLGVAFMEDRLQLDNGLVPSKIVSVLLQESALKQLEVRQHLASQKNLISLSPSTQTETFLSDPSQGFSCDWLAEPQKGSLLRAPERNGGIEQMQESQPFHNSQVFGTVCKEEVQSLGNHHHMDGNGHPLHLSSCHECLELENSTILSVRYASVENIPELPDDSSTDLVSGYEAQDDGKGFLDQCGSINSNVKPPNVLVYTGGCQERYQIIHELLTECISMDNYVIYHLQPQHVLTGPWLESTMLLLLAEEEPLEPEIQTCFLTYLSQGGKVLGLSSTLCPAGLSLEARHGQHRQVSTLSFTREDSTELELSVLANGNVFIRDQWGGGEVELWGELKQAHLNGERDMVIVRMTHGDDGGEAVLCQVHLELTPDSQQVTAEGFNDLKVSNVHRYEVLTEILTSLGLSCERNQDPLPTAINILSTSQKRRADFLMWLHNHADKDGLIKLTKASLKLVSSAELQDGHVLPQGCLALDTNPPESQSWENFNLETYSKHLQSHLLGHVVLYTDVTPSTMDLLEGLTLHLSKKTGLIAIAGRQTRGKGRRGNVWLSPKGCAMFTLNVQVELNSRLGQRIPFLQHLAALAVVEAVRTLPGYQNIDLRVKWPNDIYYSNRVKLGGVLVTSTVMGPTFHLLIGCGFNVSNSNPTICINDLVRQHNREHSSSLEALDMSQLIARTVTSLEGLISVFQQEGPEAILPIYYKRWIHSGTCVHLWSKDGPEAKVVGLDDNGFLQVYCEEKGVVSVEPDGNSFDMLRNLVVTKQH
ncbi:biotin--protein ligase isoform X2 [Lampris incognitus]|uniref:biotin--protein ligase isoform X2 n=1 Tax=Lampris incognitus TaxID=2546036 RepID=UPI0024B5347B|nr:biotin--protein ligase isoform X2 [Lampris incognitus]